MAQVMVNFRIDEDVKKHGAGPPRDGLSVMAASTIFAAKAEKEKRSSLEATGERHDSGQRRRQRRLVMAAQGAGV